MIEQEPQSEGPSITTLTEHLIKSILSQKLSPEILPYQQSTIDHLKSSIQDQESRLEIYHQEPDISSLDKNFKFSLYKLDINRLSYLLKNYLRTRLFKLQRYAFYVVKSSEALARLSQEEQEFVVGYAKLRYEFFDAHVLKDLHKDFRNLAGMEVIFGSVTSQSKKDSPSRQAQLTIEAPPLESFRFFKIHSNPEQLRYQIDILVENMPSDHREIISEEDILFIPYSMGEKLLSKGLATLI